MRNQLQRCGAGLLGMLIASVLTWGVTRVTGAEVTSSSSKPVPAAADNPLSLYDGKLVFDMQERLRLEERDNTFDFNDRINAKTDQLFLLQRFRLGARYAPLDWLTVYAQGQDAREIDSKRAKVPYVLGSEGDDPFDLRQAYLAFGNPKEFPVSLTVGRQELLYGDQRLVGNFDWNNFGRTFDAAKLRYVDPGKQFTADAFVAHVVTIETQGPQPNYGFNLDDANWNDTLAGFYFSTTILPVQTTDLYLFYRNKLGNGPVYTDGLGDPAAYNYDVAEEIFTTGFRIKSTPGQLDGFDYEAEAAYQTGRAAGRQGAVYPGPTMLDHEAFAAHLGGGYRWEDVAWKPRVGLECNIASGDSNPNDNKDESFLNLFPTNHGLYGIMDLFGWKNTENIGISLRAVPYQDKEVAWRSLTVDIYGRAFWLYSTSDAWYRANATTIVRYNNTAPDAFVGEEMDLVITYTPWKFIKLQAGYSHFFSGDYVKDTVTATGGSSDANFGYLQTVITF